jgi:outer membrane receptor for Fe3+-dicitrate
MGAGTSVSSLKRQRATVKAGMEDTRQWISNAGDKVKRLQAVSSSMETSIQSLRNIRATNIDDFEVTKAKWKGEEENQFEAKYNSYGIYVKAYDYDTSKAKQQIDEDLEAARQEKAYAVTGLENLQGILDGLESDIKAAKED